MDELASLPQEGNLLTRFMSRIGCEYIPRQYKRLFFLISAFGFLTKKKKINPMLIDELNQRFKITSSNSNFAIALSMSENFWKEDLLKLSNQKRLADCKDEDIWGSCIKMARASAPWMRYGSISLMTADLHDMVVATSLNKEGRNFTTLVM